MSPRRRAHPLRPALPLLAALSFCTVGACQPKPSPASAEPVDEPDPLRDELVQHVPDRPEESLVFPPPWSDRRSRPALVIEDDKVKAVEESADEAFAVRYPNVEGSGKFHFSGQSFTVSFNKPVKLPRKLRKKPVPADAGTVTIEPEVKGKARWVSARVLEFTADKPYDPDLFYKVTIAGLTSDPQVEGEEPEALAPWTAEFSAEPRIYLAGKVLTYLPRKGEEKVIAVYPPEGAKVGVDVELGVIFDQPIGLAKAGKLITLTKSDNKPVKFTLSHAASTSYQGSKVNKRQVVIVTPEAPFSPGDELELRATDGTRELLSDPEVTVHDFHIAAPLELSDVRCGYGYNNTCEYKAPKLLMSGRDVAVEFNNAIATTGGALKAAVTVSPPVLNMSVWSSGTWEGTGIVRISGDFKSSTRYNVRIAGLRDRYGDELDEPVSLQVTTMPQTASASMPEGALVLDETASKAFKVTTRNVVRAALEVWPVDADDPRALEKAKRHASRHTKPEEDAPIKIPFMPQVARDEFVTTELDLLGKLTSGTSYLIALSIEGTAFGAKETEYPSWSRAQSDPVALITPGDARALAIHTHATGDATVVHVARLGDGTPVPGASFKLNGEAITGAPTTDSNGVAVLPIKQNSLSGGVLSVAASGANAALSAGPGGVSGDSLFPSMASADAAAELLDSDERVVLMTDRGIYRPGATVHIKAMYRRKVGERYTPITNTPVQVTVTGPQDDEIETLQGVTNDMGGVAFDFESPAGGKVGRHELVFSSVEDEAPLARAFVQIAEFEPPRFTVDVDAREAGKAKLQATVAGRYLFGAPMDGSEVEWTLTRSAASLPAGKLSDAGLAFDDGRDDYYYWDDDRSEERWSRSGRGTLAADGTLVLNQKVELGDAGPVRFELEADVADASYRHIAGRGSVVLHPAQRYAGVKVASSWGPVGKPMSVGLGVADREGAPVEGATVTAKLVRVTWKYTRRSDASGTHYDWHATRTQVDSCSVTSARTVVACELTPPRSGEYDVISSVDGRDGGARSIWSWGDGSDRALFPTKGRKLDIVTDKGSYKPGDTAKLLVRNPYPAATAILTLEQGKLLTHRAIAMTGAAEIIEVPILRAHTPHVHATITVLPRGATGDDRVDWKIGAVRLPVSMDAERLKLEVKTDRDAYEPGQEVTIDLTLRDGTKPAPGSEIAVAVVDEGILRMTNHHAPDPVKALRPGQPLDFRVEDTREGLAAFLRLSQTAGDGDASEGNASQARKNFVETALWRPDVRTNARGEAQIKFTLPDNLTRFRVMAVALDGDGKGASSEHGFYVRKPVMAMPVVPRFAHVGDAFEAAVMVHNNLSEPMTAHVTLGDETRDVVLAGESRSRVGFPMQPPRPGPLALEFTVRDDAEVRDRVLVTVPVARPGVLEHPRLDGAFVKRQAIELKVPAKVVSGRGGKETVRVLVGQHLWPELGARLEYLLDYPHGCVEQTTSSTLPLLAARDILPRIGVSGMSQVELDKRIKVGLERYVSMKTSSGGLGYWPGDSSPNVYGTAYAIRAVIAAKQAGLELPSGLLEGMQHYLDGELLDAREPEVKAAIAQSLAELDALPASAADALWDTRGEQGVFGMASLAIALSHLPGQESRVDELMADVEASFDAEGKLLKPPGYNDFYYYGSATRTKAQALIGLGRLRKASTMRPILFRDLSSLQGHYTTQSTAYSLMAMAEQLVSASSDGAAFTVSLDGKPLTPAEELQAGSKAYEIPLDELVGKDRKLTLESDSEAAVAYMIDAVWTRDLADVGGLAGTSAKLGPNVHRVYTDAKGAPLKLDEIKPGQIVRVALLAELPTGELERERMSYLAITDRLPAGFEPVQTDLWTVARVPELSDDHPFARWLRWGSNEPSYLELRDDRVHVYFDRVWGDRALATYLARASTPGTFALPPATGEFMYVAGSQSYSEGGVVVISK